MAITIPAKQVRGQLKPAQIDLSGATLDNHPADRGFVKTQIAASLAGLDVKNSVRAASTGNITLTAPGTTMDGVILSVGDRVLLKNQATASQNGIYVFNGAAVALTRSADASTSAMVTSQLAVSVSEGTVNTTTTWKLNTPDLITLDATPLNFGLFSTNYYATPTTANKNMACLVTVNDNDLATNTAMAATPAQGSYVYVKLNGISGKVGNATKAACDFYFSGDNGTTARAQNAIAAGDKVYYVGSANGGVQLDATDVLDFDYVA